MYISVDLTKMKKPNIVNKLDLPEPKWVIEKRLAEENMTREEYLGQFTNKSQLEFETKTFDLRVLLKSAQGKEKFNIIKQIVELRHEYYKPLPPYDNDYYDIDFPPSEIGYDESGMRDDDEYNPKNWEGHTD